MISWNWIQDRNKRKRIAILSTLFIGSFACVVVITNTLSPWNTVLRIFNVVLVADDCQFSEVAAACLNSTPRKLGQPPRAVAVPTAIQGDFSRKACDNVRSILSDTDDIRAHISLSLIPEDTWCQRLANGGRDWLFSNREIEQWPTFVHEGDFGGVGLTPGNFEVVGESDVAARLDECIDDYLQR